LLEFLQKIDVEVFLFLNNLHSGFFDIIMFQLTKQLIWLPLFIIVIFFLFKYYKNEAWWLIAGIVFIILISDQFISGFMKPFFERLRPSHDPVLENLVHLVNEYRGGLYGFASSHAGNSFGVAMFLWLTVRVKIPWIWIMFVWAFIFSYTRIYLGVHYPADIIVGGAIGATFALFIDWFIRIVRLKLRSSA